MAAALPSTARPPSTPLRFLRPFKPPSHLKLTSPVPLGRTGSILPAVKAQNTSPDYVHDSKFYKVEAVVRSWRVPHVSSELLKMGIRGMTISDVKGFGAQGGYTERHGGSEFSEGKFVSKTKMEIVVSKDQVSRFEDTSVTGVVRAETRLSLQVDVVIEKIMEESRTGEIGDGKIFLIPVSDVIRIRTGERGEKAEKMEGGFSDMISAEGSSG